MLIPQDLGPELSQLVTIADFNNMILLHYSSIEPQLLFFELGKCSVSNIDRKEIRELSMRNEVAFIPLHTVLQTAYIILVLEHGGHRLLSSCHIFDVLLGLMKLFDLFRVCIHSLLVAIETTFEGLQVVKFALDPMIQVNKWVLHCLL